MTWCFALVNVIPVYNNGIVWYVYKVSDVSLKTHMGGCGGGVCWYSAMVTSPRSAPPRPPSALTSFHTWELLCLQLEYFTQTGLQCVCLCGIRISNALFTVWLICHQIRHLVHYFVNYIGGDSFDKMSRLLKNIHICWYGKTDVTSNTNKTLLLIHSQHTCICIDTMLQWLL